MRTVYLIRHGESEFNRQKRFAGWSDCGLTDLGLNQASAAASRMSDIGNVDAIFSSDLIRAKKTAQIIADKLHVPLTITEALRETNLGAWEGLTVEQIEDRDPEMLKRWFTDFADFSYPGGESVGQMLQRGNDFVRTLLGEYETILIVAHAGIISTLLSYWLVGDTAHTNIFRVKNARVQRVIFNGEQCSLDLFNG